MPFVALLKGVQKRTPEFRGILPFEFSKSTQAVTKRVPLSMVQPMRPEASEAIRIIWVSSCLEHFELAIWMLTWARKASLANGIGDCSSWAIKTYHARVCCTSSTGKSEVGISRQLYSSPGTSPVKFRLIGVDFMGAGIGICFSCLLDMSEPCMHLLNW